MRTRSWSRLLYRNVLIAAGLAAALGVGAACAEPGAALGAQSHRDGYKPQGRGSVSTRSQFEPRKFLGPQSHVDVTLRQLRR
jgi:hypothetical protein